MYAVNLVSEDSLQKVSRKVCKRVKVSKQKIMQTSKPKSKCKTLKSKCIFKNTEFSKMCGLILELRKNLCAF